MSENTIDYKTPDNNKRCFWDKALRLLNFYFYTKSTRIIIHSTKYVDTDEFYHHFIDHCGQILDTVESTGGTVEYSGLSNIPDEPCVYIGNHMSTLETITLGNVINTRGRLSFVIKESLTKYPYFNQILSALDCITVTRTNPIQDLKKILREGPALLEKGISIVVFPQHTRGEFTPEEFSSIGCKLAKRAKVPVVPLALDTRFWGKGKYISDFGPIRRDIPVRFAFGEKLVIDKNEKEVHAKCLDFIGSKLEDWGAYTPQNKSSD
jgi:1-acyl-sn-glycerol-3-phosphate acyltransferase